MHTDESAANNVRSLPERRHPHSSPFDSILSQTRKLLAQVEANPDMYDTFAVFASPNPGHGAVSTCIYSDSPEALAALTLHALEALPYSIRNRSLASILSQMPKEDAVAVLAEADILRFRREHAA